MVICLVDRVAVPAFAVRELTGWPVTQVGSRGLAYIPLLLCYSST